MTLIMEHLWVLAFYAIALLFGVVVCLRKTPRIVGFANMIFHAAAVIVMFSLGGALEDIMLFLVFSSAVSLLIAYFMHLREDNK